MQLNHRRRNIKKPVMTLMVLIVTLLMANTLLAATHNIALSAEVLPNGQLAYKMISHTSSDGGVPNYPDEAVIPGPTLFVTKGDAVNVSLTNNTQKNVQFQLPAPLNMGNGNNISVAPGETGSFKINTNTNDAAGTHPYGDMDSALLGLFGAVVIDNEDGQAQKLIDGDGAIKAVNQADLDKEFVMYMVGSTFWGTEIANGTQTPIWTNPTLGAVEGELVRFHILSIGPGHTFHLHAHRWLEEQRIADQGAEPSIIDVKLMSEPVSSHAFTIRAGTGVGTGFWQYHCHLISHMESGMNGKFHVVSADSGGSGNSVAGASPHGAIFGNNSDVPGLVTFEISDEPGSWFRSARADTIFSITESTKSLEIIPPGSSVHFIMNDTNAVHTMTTLLWPSDADDPDLGDPHMIPFDQSGV